MVVSPFCFALEAVVSPSCTVSVLFFCVSLQVARRPCTFASHAFPPPFLDGGASPRSISESVDDSYLVDPASHICLSQRLSHASLSIKIFYI